MNCINDNIPIKEAISILNSVEDKLLVVLNECKVVKGSITDGDVRRGILKGISLESSVRNIMNMTPVVMYESDSPSKIIATMERELLFFVPLVDSNKRFLKLLSLKVLKKNKNHDCAVFILAGGLGSRLKELTKETPKPMLPIDGKPMLESLIISFKEQGFFNFYISVNYLKERIISYFNDGSSLGVNIIYVTENKRLGTAGPLSLLEKNSFSESKLIIINSDVRVKSDFNALLRYHLIRKNHMTVCAKEYKHQLPYGVIQFEDDSILSIDEKPVSSFFVNAGIYLIDRELFDLLDKNVYYDMPDYINKLKAFNYNVGLYPLHEDWLDVGTPPQYAEALEHEN